MKDAKTMSETGSAVAARKRVRRDKSKPVPTAMLTPREAKMLLAALTALKQGDSSVRLPVEWTGMQGKLAETFNDVVELNERMAEELVAPAPERSARKASSSSAPEIGDVRGFWRDSDPLA